MKLEKALQFVTHHSEAITQWLFLAILLLSGALVARGLFARRSDDAEGATLALGGVAAESTMGVGSVEATGPSPELQAALTKIMEQTAKLESISLGELNPASLQQVNSQVEGLKRDLALRETEIAQLKASGESKPSADAGDLSSRIKELEAKLAEYEILEDDIADLSLYKEENNRLREEIEKMKSGGAPAPAPVAAKPAPAPDPAPVLAANSESAPPPATDLGALAASAVAAASDDIVAEFAQAVGQESSPSTQDPALVDVQVPDTGNPMADFENTVKLEKQMKPQSVPESAPTANVSSEEKDDLFAEFTQSQPEAGEDEFGANLDTDKMMAEMAALVGHEPGGNALEEEVDTDKMVLEMSGLNSKA